MKHIEKNRKLVYYTIFIFITFVLTPIWDNESWTIIMGTFIVSLIPILGVYCANHTRKNILIILFMGVPFVIINLLIVVFVLYGMKEIYSSLTFHIIGTVSMVLGIICHIYTIYVILRHVFRAHYVRGNTICGSISVYFLIGIMWGLLFAILYFYRLAAFSFSTDINNLTLNDIIYYSFITLTTVGYGDIIPGNEVTRFLSIGEAIMGQIYLTVLVGMLIGKYLTHSLIDPSKSRLLN